jgi:hypothetical protein
LTGELTQNSTAAGIKGTITSAKFGGTTGKTISGDEEPECTGTGFYAGGAAITVGTPICIESTGTTDTFAVRGGTCAATSKPKFKISLTTIFGTVTCNYESTSINGLVGSFVTNESGSDVTTTLLEQGFTKAEGSGGECPSEGKLNMTTTSEMDSASAEPVFVSS